MREESGVSNLLWQDGQQFYDKRPVLNVAGKPAKKTHNRSIYQPGQPLTNCTSHFKCIYALN